MSFQTYLKYFSYNRTYKLFFQTKVNDEVRLKTESLASDDKSVTITANVYGNCSTKPDLSSSVYTDTFTRTLEHDVDNVNLQG